MDESNHSTVLFTVHYQPSRMIIDPGSAGGGDEVEYYPVTDVQGTVYRLLDASGVEVADYTYSPFGERLTNTSLTTPPSTPPYMPLGFGGTYSDDDIGLLYAKSRYYDPHTTRFTTKDSYRGSKGSIISQNRYIYCHQNPILYADPAGYAPVEGDHADPCTTTDQDIHYEPDSSDLLPPEDLPCSANPDGWKKSGKKNAAGVDTWIPEGIDVIVNEDGSFTISIGDISVDVTVTLVDGKLFFQFSGSSDPTLDHNERKESWDLANGLNDAFSDPALNGVLHDLAAYDWNLFHNTIDYLTLKFYDEARSAYGLNYRDWGYSIAVGYAIGAELYSLFDDSEIKDIQKIIDSGIMSGLTFFETLCLSGLWNAYFNSSYNDLGERVLDIAFKGDGFGSGINGVAGLVEVTQLAYFTWFFFECAELEVMEEVPDHLTGVDLFNMVRKISYIFGLDFLAPKHLKGVTVLQTLWNLFTGGGDKDKTDSLDLLNHAGVTRGMRDTLFNNGLKHDYINTPSMTFATSAHYLSLHLNIVHSFQGELLMGDLFVSVTNYLTWPILATNRTTSGEALIQTYTTFWHAIMGGNFDMEFLIAWIEERYWWDE